MIVKIDTQEKEMLEYVAAVLDLQCRIFTIENNPNLVQAEVLHENGTDLSSETAWYLCASVQTKVASNKVVSRNK
jgi:hypothetical protein